MWRCCWPSLKKKHCDTVWIKDKEGNIVQHEGGPLHLHEHDTSIPGLYHFGVYLEGVYYPSVTATPAPHHDHMAAMANPEPASNATVNTAAGELFTRILNITLAVVS